MYIIQSMIVSLSDKIENINEVAINGIYDDDLYAEVKNLKPIFNQTGEDIDKEFIIFWRFCLSMRLFLSPIIIREMQDCKAKVRCKMPLPDSPKKMKTIIKIKMTDKTM